MNRADLFREIVETYSKYGWTLRRVLLTDETQRNLPDLNNMFKGVPVKVAEIDAAWFSRPSANKREAWELRRLHETPFALFESFARDTPEEERENVRREMEKTIKNKQNQ